MMRPGVTAKVLEGPLMGVEELRQPLGGADLVEAAPAEAEREHEDVEDSRLLAEVYRGRPPVDLALAPRRRLEARHGPLGEPLRRPQGADEALHRVVAAPVALLPQFLEEDLGGVADLRGPGPQILGMRRQQRLRRGRPLIRSPRRIAQTPADGLAIELKSPRQLGDRDPVLLPEPTQFLPTLLTDHRHLLGQGDLRSDGPCSSLTLCRHLIPSFGKEGGDISMTTGGDYWMTADSAPGRPAREADGHGEAAPRLPRPVLGPPGVGGQPRQERRRRQG